MTRRRMKHPQSSRDALVAAIADGLTTAKAAALAGIPARTVSDWLRKGRQALDEWDAQVDDLYPDGEEPPEDADLPELDDYAAFALDAAKAIAERELLWLEGLHAAEGSSWTRFAWLLERTAPEDYSLRDVRRIELTAGGPIRAPGAVDAGAVLRVLAAAGVAADDEQRDGDEVALLDGGDER